MDYLRISEKPILQYLDEKLPFPMVREVLGHLRGSFVQDQGWACWTLLRCHYDRRVCARCGEFMDGKMYAHLDPPRKRLCLCKYRASVFEARPRLRVNVRPVMYAQGATTRWFRRLSTSTLDMIRDISTTTIKDMYLVVDNQIEVVYNFRRVIAFLERVHRPEQVTQDHEAFLRHLLIDVLCEMLVEEVQNMRTYPIFVYSNRVVPGPWNLVDYTDGSWNHDGWVPYPPRRQDDPHIKKKHAVLPFMMPVQYFYPHIKSIRDLPLNARSSFLEFFKTRWCTVPTTVPYDPLHLLSS